MKKLILLSVFTLFLPVISFFSCCREEAGYFDIKGVKLSNSVVSRESFSDGRFVRETADGETVSFADHYLSAPFNVSYFAQREAAGASPAGAAYALSCYDTPYSQEGLDTLYVITLNAWERGRPVGDTINDIVEIAPYVSRYEDLERFEPLSTYFSDNRDAIWSPYLAVRIRRLPEFRNTDHAFRLVYHLENGEVHIGETNTIRFE